MQLTAADDRVILSRFYEFVSADREWFSDEFAAIVKLLRPRATSTATVPDSSLIGDAHVDRRGRSTLSASNEVQRNGIERVRSPPISKLSW
jgi:hypothetical protein